MTELLAASPFAGVTATQVIMLALAIVFLTIVMVSTGRRVRESKALTGRPVREKYAELDNQQAVRRDVEQVMLELDKVARQVHARIDTKLARLEALIRDADQRIQALASAVPAPREMDSKARPSRKDESVSVATGCTEPERERFDQIYRLSREGLSAAQIAEKVERPQGEVELILGLKRARGASRSVSTEPVGRAE